MKKRILILLSVLFLSISIVFSITSKSNSANYISDEDGCYFEGPYGAISAVYYSYGLFRGSLNPLGCPVSNEKNFYNDAEVPFGEEIDKYQEFEHGSIYYNSTQKSAFALFNKVDEHYQSRKDNLGLPITSEIGNALLYPYNCRAYFQNGYIQCTNIYMQVESRYWSDIGYAAEVVMKRDFPELKMPFSKNFNGEIGIFSGGPHAWYLGGLFNETMAPGRGSGIDIAGSNMSVYAMAPGTVIDVFPDPVTDGYVDCHTRLSGLGCWVAIRHDFSGTVMIYGHIQPWYSPYTSPDSIEIGDHVYTGQILGNTTGQIIGNSSGPHVHLEYRSGINYTCTIDCINTIPQVGQPIDWHGVVIDDTLISGGIEPGTTTRYNYDGSAVRLTGIFDQQKYSQNEISSNFGDILKFPTWLFYEPDGTGPKSINSWMTNAAWDTCHNDPEYADKCELAIIPPSYDNTIFSGGGFIPSSIYSTNHSTNSGGGYFISSNEETVNDPPYEEPYPNPQPTPTQGGPITNCPTNNQEGVYFYENTYYSGDCYFTTTDTPNFGLTEVGNDRLSSVKIIGDYRARLYEDINYGGRYDELNDSDPNLDIRSLGDQYSSAKISETTIPCPTDGREGVYMYSDIEYQGDCLFSTVNIPFFGDTVIGDNDLSSIRFIGYWDAKIYEDANYEGRYDVIGSNDPNLNIRSLGGQYSSGKMIQNNPSPTPTPPPNQIILLSSSINNGGFESASMAGWTSSGGTFVIDTANPHSGWYYVKGTSATEAKFYRYFDLTQYQSAINDGRVSSSWRVYIDVGDSEQFTYIVRFLDVNNNILYSYNTGWSWHDGGYDDWGGHLNQLPVNTAKAYIEFKMRRSSGDFTDCDVDDFYLDLFIEPETQPTPTPTLTPTPIPDCFSNQDTRAIVFDYSYCNDFAGKLPLGVENSLLNLTDVAWDNRISSLYIPNGKSMLIYEGENGTGEYVCLNNSVNDLGQLVFDDGSPITNKASSIISYPEEDCPQILANDFSINDNPLAGEVVTAEYNLRNISGRPLGLSGILVGVHGPYCETWDCPNISDFPWATDIVIEPGQTYRYSQERAFYIVDDQYFYEYLTVDNNNTWKSYKPTSSLVVSRGIEITEPVTLTPPIPFVGQEVNAQFTIKNFGTRTISLPYLMVVAKGPNCDSWDCPDGWADFPWVTNLSLDPGEEYTYSQSRPFYRSGEGYLADAAFGDNNIWWYEVPNNTRYNFYVIEPFKLFLPVIKK